MNKVINQLKEVISEEKILLNEPMKNHTTFRIGGPADIFIVPDTIEEIKTVCEAAKKQGVPVFVLGNGSNLLVADEGMDGIVLQIYKNFSGITVNGNEITIKAGTLLSTAAKVALSEELTGFEFAGGIPGTFGGAVVMNAGAYGGEIVQVLKEVTVLTKEGDVKTIPAQELELGYRTSNILKNEYIVLEGTIVLKKGNPEEIQAKMDEYSLARRTKQPLEYPSAGSTFKRPEGYFAGKLIQDAGLRGYQVGGARVSDKHCGFVINQENATAADVMQLIADVQKKVKEQFGVNMEPEVKRVGRF
ncbi:MULTISPECIES: UDP-N-acetylmuramate dehydrogenase [Anaerostipes]|uniref:UDP-N-acetylmuramate dehydrogenase n=1 Tax=Anaerostipes TaxID=207244 RepID=UPI0009532C98|nr:MULTISPECIES: UDP-N-acetylmuramate dehydrogenase [Anaerostipes]MCI5623471.1 UDP-N-acetylmuramate dehydrogenase [Anaerostipes sp.]MDY2726465.1 UDP-N-acetylmuramate dehydrogenase [Anaerostipes faecalis]OLR59317.1 UDP-N-acetylenolpyruvoylglucosamine reductase [Anaerostipes sp. 494a]